MSRFEKIAAEPVLYNFEISLVKLDENNQPSGKVRFVSNHGDRIVDFYQKHERARKKQLKAALKNSPNKQ